MASASIIRHKRPLRWDEISKQWGKYPKVFLSTEMGRTFQTASKMSLEFLQQATHPISAREPASTLTWGTSLYNGHLFRKTCFSRQRPSRLHLQCAIQVYKAISFTSEGRSRRIRLITSKTTVGNESRSVFLKCLHQLTRIWIAFFLAGKFQN